MFEAITVSSNSMRSARRSSPVVQLSTTSQPTTRTRAPPSVERAAPPRPRLVNRVRSTSTTASVVRMPPPHVRGLAGGDEEQPETTLSRTVRSPRSTDTAGSLG